ncbi:MAG: TRAP transporter TatT component family protein [Bacteroidota bacterium]
MKHFLVFVVPASVMFAGCMQSIAVSTVGGIIDEGFVAFTEEDDLEFAEQALPGNLKLLAVWLKSEPENERLLRLASEGYSSYALAFLEEEHTDRARSFYLRGRDYGLRLLIQKEEVAEALGGSPDDLRAALEGQDRDLAPGAFWTAFGWGGYINITLTSPDAIADLPRAEALMEFVADRDSSYYFGGADIFLGALYGSRPKMLGGDVDRSRTHFERALAINEGKFLMTHVYYARSYAVQTQDEALFEKLLTTVERASLEILPDYRLANAVAKEKAKLLLARKSDLF